MLIRKSFKRLKTRDSLQSVGTTEHVAIGQRMRLVPRLLLLGTLACPSLGEPVPQTDDDFDNSMLETIRVLQKISQDEQKLAWGGSYDFDTILKMLNQPGIQKIKPSHALEIIWCLF